MDIHEKNNVRKLLTKLKKEGIEVISIYFEGSGDSGDFYSVELYEKSDNFDPHDLAEYSTTLSNEKLTFDERKLLERFFEYIDNLQGHDWYNNDGGSGRISINLKTGEVTTCYNIRYTEYNSYEDKINIKEFTL